MVVGATVQARMSSRRLPGKVLMPLAGRPMISWVVERLRRAPGLDRIIVTTSTDPDDDAVAELCEREGVECFRGDLDDVAGRLAAAADQHALDALVRISGDSPLIDQEIVSRGVELYRAEAPDLVTNVYPRRTCPFGESVEVLARPALERALGLMAEPADREHVTPALYRNAGEFEIRSFDLGEDLSGPSLIVDEPEDAEVVEAILARMDRPHWQYPVREVLALRESVLAEREGATP